MSIEELESIRCPVCDEDQTKYLFTKDSLSIVKCMTCGLRYVNPRISAQSLAETYAEDYYPQEKIESIHSNVMERLQMQERLSEIERWAATRGHILDVGCGLGTFLHLAEENGWKTYGVDPSESVAAFARERYSLDVSCGDVFGADFPNHHFDVITMYHVLEHIPQPNPFLEELKRILKPQTGLLVIEVPNGSSIQSRILREKWPYIHPRDHLYYFSYQTLSRLLSKHDFDQMWPGRPKRVNPDKGLLKGINFAWRKAITRVLVSLRLSTTIRVYARYGLS